MAEPRSEASARDLIKRMDTDILAEWHPAHYASPALDEMVSELAPMKGVWVDIATGTGRRLFQLLEATQFSGTVYAIEFQQDNAKGLIKRFQEQKNLNQRINLIVLVTDATKLLQKDTVTAILSNNTIPQYENPFYSAQTKVNVVSTTEFWHEAWSCPALEHKSAEAGDRAYNASMNATVGLINKRGYLFFQDLHGVDKNILVGFSYKYNNRQQGGHAVKWITGLDSFIPSNFLNQELAENDDRYWVKKRLQLLRDTIAGGVLDPSEQKIPLNVLTEAGYRVVEKDGLIYVDRDHEMHCAKTGNTLIADMIKAGSGSLKKLQIYEARDDTARKFFEHAGIEIEVKNIPPIYTAAVLQKQ